jgi:hypothetical protein
VRCKSFLKIEITLGTSRAFEYMFLVPMNRTQYHQRGIAGTSITKAVASCRAQMRPVARNRWNKVQADAGFQA